MRKVIEGKIYDTDKAELLHVYENMPDKSNFDYSYQELYITEKGNLFVTDEGYDSEVIFRTMDMWEALEWLEMFDGHEVMVNDERFSDWLEEA